MANSKSNAERANRYAVDNVDTCIMARTESSAYVDTISTGLSVGPFTARSGGKVY